MSKRPAVMSLDDLMGSKVDPPAEVVEPVAVEAPPVPETAAEASPALRQGGRKPVPDTFRTSVYFHRSVHDALREIAFDERLTISDLINEGLDTVLKGRGYPSAADLKSRGGGRRKRGNAGAR